MYIHIIYLPDPRSCQVDIIILILKLKTDLGMLQDTCDYYLMLILYTKVIANSQHYKNSKMYIFGLSMIKFLSNKECLISLLLYYYYLHAQNFKITVLTPIYSYVHNNNKVYTHKHLL